MTSPPPPPDAYVCDESVPLPPPATSRTSSWDMSAVGVMVVAPTVVMRSSHTFDEMSVAPFEQVGAALADDAMKSVENPTATTEATRVVVLVNAEDDIGLSLRRRGGPMEYIDRLLLSTSPDHGAPYRVRLFYIASPT